MAPFLFGSAPDSAGALRIARSSLLRASICSLIAAARLSWVIVRSNKFMAPVKIQGWWKSSTGQVLLAGDDARGRYLRISFPDDRARRQVIQGASTFQAKRSCHWRPIAAVKVDPKFFPLVDSLSTSVHAKIRYFTIRFWICNCDLVSKNF